MKVGIVSGSEQATYRDISYLWRYTWTEARNFTVQKYVSSRVKIECVISQKKRKKIRDILTSKILRFVLCP